MEGRAPGGDNLGSGADDALQEFIQLHGGAEGLPHLEEHRQLGDALFGFFLDNGLAQSRSQHQAGQMDPLALGGG